MVTIFGIANCDKCRAARKWFVANDVEHRFHDLRADGLTEAMLSSWLQRLSIAQLLNKRSRTWKELSDAERAKATDSAAGQLLLTHPTLIKRPLVDTGSTLVVGYDEQRWQDLFH